MEKELNFAIDLAKKAGEIIKANFVFGMKKEWKKDNSPVTETDLKINQLVIDSVKKEFPDHKILAEEGSDMSGNGDYVWVCDPVDGTIPFSHGVPTCVFSLALVKNGESILGVVYDPFMDRMYSAVKGQGAFLNGDKISVSKANTIKNTIVGLTFWKEAPFQFYESEKILKENSVKLINVLSVIYMSMMVASGEFSTVVFPGNAAHDAATVKIIVEEAGGKVTDLFGNEQRYDRETKGFLATNGILHDEFLRIIKESMK